MELFKSDIKIRPTFKKVFSKQNNNNKIRSDLDNELSKKTSSPFPNTDLISLIDKEKGKDVRLFIQRHINLKSEKTLITATSTRFNIQKLPVDKYESIVNLKKVNTFRWLNKFLEAVNEKLPVEGIFIDSVEIYTNRKKRILNKFLFPFNRIYYFFDVIYTRLIPKLPWFKKLYFWWTRGEYRVLSKAETFGRLYSCGFEVIEEQVVGNELYFVAKKIKKPVYDNNPTYGPVIRLKRHGKDGKLFNVYKLRTMHAYSEYLQDYVYKQNNLKEGGKFKDDFRITTEGKFFRKFWLDELPMIINLLKGDMKLVGVRPLSSHYFSLYTDELKQKRIKFKPGLVPPFYVDLPKTLDEIMDSELRYLEQYEKHPFKTDVKYFFKAIYNIIFKKARSN